MHAGSVSVCLPHVLRKQTRSGKQARQDLHACLARRQQINVLAVVLTMCNAPATQAVHV